MLPHYCVVCHTCSLLLALFLCHIHGPLLWSESAGSHWLRAAKGIWGLPAVDLGRVWLALASRVIF